ncbi:PIG-L family deacetylase [Paenibacillus koleovorans]|uniref:PIG-L family deacetylase n=1 Tax=Paenibacillus koleovorans TaxID=121608 RepID=UPI000FDA8E2A|nr:PIG-L family deacetylase [Paenibacillus koleovorans]
MTQKKWLLVLAHPDDESFICGGILAKYAKLGVDIHLVCATKGEMGRRVGNPPYVTRESMPRLRERELAEACERLGIRQPIYLGLMDKTVEYEPVERLKMTILQYLSEIQPEAVLTFHERLGGHPDHCAIGLAATAAYYEAKRSNTPPGLNGLFFITYGESMKDPTLYGIPREKRVAVDVSDSRREKLYAYRAHRCQTEIDPWVWLPDEKALEAMSRTEYLLRDDGELELS